MVTVALEPASRWTYAELAEIFNAAYEGYFTPFALDEAAFRFMSTTWDDDLDASRVALVDGEPAGICKLAVRVTAAGSPASASPLRTAARASARRSCARHRGGRAARPARNLARGARPEPAGDPALREARLPDCARPRGLDAGGACVSGTQASAVPAARRRRGSARSARGASRGSARTSGREPGRRRGARERARRHALPPQRRAGLAAAGRRGERRRRARPAPRPPRAGDARCTG